VLETLKRAQASKSSIKRSTQLWCGPIQGSIHPGLLRKCASGMAELDFAIHPIGSVVPLLVQYDLSSIMPIISTVKETVPAYRLIHLFGAGHPIFFVFAVAMGVDLFDSAAYALYAADNRYLTSTDTKRLEEIKYFPCSCPICTKYTPKELNEQENKERLLAEHNLYVTFEELRSIKQAIKEKTLWELLEYKARTHPALLECMNYISKHSDYFLEYDPLTKNHFFYLSDFSAYRPEVYRTRDRIKKIKSETMKIQPFGAVPKTIFECYPFSQTVLPDAKIKSPRIKNSIDKLKDVSLYWFGANIFSDNIRLEVSRKTNKIRAAYENGKLIATLRANDFAIILHEGARILHEKTKRMNYRVVIDDKEIEKYIKSGSSVFARHLKACDKNIIPGEQVLVVNKKDELLASGEALLNSREMLEFKHGVAVKTHWINKV
jgi:7-cyano-7-deazaguanine tRNA-ribosyltransferase